MTKRCCITVYLYLGVYLHQYYVGIVCRVDNIYLSWTLEYQIRLLLTQM